MGGKEKPEEDKDEAEEPKVKGSIRGLLAFADGIDAMLMLIALAASIGVGVAQGWMLIIFQDFMQSGGDSFATGGGIDMDMISNACLWITIIGILMSAGGFIFISVGNLAATRQKIAWRKAVVKSVLRQEIGWFDVSKPEQLTTKIGACIEQVYKGLEGPVFMISMSIGLAVVGFYVAFDRNPATAGVILAAVPVVGATFGLMGYTLLNGAKVKSAAYASAGGIATECLFAMRTVASLSLEHDFADEYKQLLAKTRWTDIRVSTMGGFTAGLAFCSFLVLQVVGFLYGGLQTAAEMERSSFDYVINQSLEVPGYPGFFVNTSLHYCAHANNTPANISINEPCAAPFQPLRMNCYIGGVLARFGELNFSLPGQNATTLELLAQDSWADFRAFTQAQAPPSYIQDENPVYYDCTRQAAVILICIFGIMNAAMSFGQIAKPLGDVAVGANAAAQLLQFIQRVSSIDSFDTKGATPSSVTGTIEVKDVYFAYPSAPEHNVCNGYSLTVPAGATVALCGPSGSGKSTIIQLVERFYDPQAGEVLLDGINIKTLNVKWLRSQLGLVGQEPVLFMGSVADNIRYGKTDATDEEVEEAAKMANAHGFILEKLNDAYDTQVGQGGSKLSGGQKQRVAIARAIIKKPAVLLLDEATSALDNESERVVQAALDEIMAKQRRTTIVIAHRLSTICNADKIAVVNKGIVVEQGTHDDLMGLGGLYHSLALPQAEDVAA